MPPLPNGRSFDGEHEAPGGRIPPPRSSVVSAYRPEWVSSASWLKSMSSVESNAGFAAPTASSRPMWKALPSHLTPESEGAPAAAQRATSRSSAPAPFPSTQSVIIAPVLNGPTDELALTAQGSGVPRGLSSRKLDVVPRLSNAPLRSRLIIAWPLAQVMRSLG
jgi:hypothetical protein